LACASCCLSSVLVFGVLGLRVAIVVTQFQLIDHS